MVGQPTLRRKLLRDIRHTWTLFAALVVSVALGLALFAGMNNSYLNLNESYDNAFATQGFPDLFVTTADATSFANSVSNAAGIDSVRTRVQADLPMSASDSAGTNFKMVGRVVGYPTSGTPEIASLTSLSGAANPAPGHALIEEHFAGDLGLAAGDSVELTTATGPVTVPIDGVVSSAEYFWPAPSRQVLFAPPGSFGVLFVSDDDAKQWSGIADNQALILLTDEERASTGAAATLDDLSNRAVSAGATEVLTRDEQPSNSVLQDDITSLHRLAVYFPLLFLFAAGLAIYVLLTRRVAEERQVIGTIRATGVRSRTLGWHYLSYALLAGLAGAIIGIPAGVAMAGGLTRQYAALISLPTSLTVFGGARLGTVVTALALALVATALAAWWPARRAMRIMPAEAMRGDVPRSTGKRSLFERLIPGSRHFSAKWRLVLRNIGRSGSRSAFTDLGVALATMLMVSTTGLYTSLTHMTTVEFSQVNLADGQAQFVPAVEDAQLQAVSQVAGVDAVESAINEPVSVAHGSDVYSTTLTGFQADTVMHGLIDTAGSAVPLPTSGFVVDGSITSQLPALTVGDDISVTFTGSDLDGQILSGTVTGFTYDPLGSFVYADRDWISQQIPAVQPHVAMLTTTPGADDAQVKSDVSALPGVVVYIGTNDLRSAVSQFGALLIAIALFMIILGSVMAFAIIFTTMSVSILERYREIATFRASGVRFSTIASSIRWENIIVAAFGIIPGVLVGLWAANYMGSSLSTDEFTLLLHVPWWTVVAVVVGILLVALLSQFPGMVRVRHMNVADVVRDRA